MATKKEKGKIKDKLEDKAQVDLAELADLSGEAAVRQRKYTVPILKFHGSKGEFSILTPDADGNYVPTPPTKIFEGVILKVRRSLGAFEKIEGQSIQYYSNEHNSFRDQLVLFQKRGETKKSNMVAEGTMKELKEIYPNLRLRQILYLLIPSSGDVVKMSVKGKSLASLFEYYREFKENEHMFEYVTKMERHTEENEGISFYVIDFIKDKKSDIELVAEKIREVASNLKLQDKSYAESAQTTKDTREGMASGGEKVEPEKPAVEKSEEKDNGEEINVENIPI